MDKNVLNEIHIHCSNNKQELLKVNKGGCFYCLKIFSPAEIKEWIKDKDGYTAICPRRINIYSIK